MSASRQRTSVLLVGLVLVALVATVWWPQPAAGLVAECDRNPETNKVTLVVDNTHDTFVRRNGDDIYYRSGFDGYQPCDDATVFNTDKIEFTDDGTRERSRRAIVNQDRGAFAPGATLESNGRSEIEFLAEFDARKPALWIKGTGGDDRIIAGSRGMKVNRDEDLDVRAEDLAQVGLYDGAGDDLLSLRGGRNTGLALFFSGTNAFLTGGSGADTLLGGLSRDRVSGGMGSDVIKGGERWDVVWGEDGNDRIFGNEDGDSLSGGDGDDRLYGNEGDDSVKGNEDDDHLEGGPGPDSLLGHGGRDHLDGDAGHDRCIPGAGVDTLEDCEE